MCSSLPPPSRGDRSRLPPWACAMRWIRGRPRPSGAPQRASGPNGPADDQVSMLDLHTDALREALERVNVETLTPIEAMNVLYQLKQML